MAEFCHFCDEILYKIIQNTGDFTNNCSIKQANKTYPPRTCFRAGENVAVLNSQENKFSLFVKDRRFLTVLS